MTHNWHEQLPGYHPDQILHDGCEECEERSRLDSRGIAHLDHINFRRAWRRAAAWNTTGLKNVTKAEAPLLNALWSVQIQLERLGLAIGELPGAAVFMGPPPD